MGREDSDAANVDSDGSMSSRIEGRVGKIEFMSNTIEVGLHTLSDTGLLSQAVKPAATRASSFITKFINACV